MSLSTCTGCRTKITASQSKDAKPYKNAKGKLGVYHNKCYWVAKKADERAARDVPQALQAPDLYTPEQKEALRQNQAALEADREKEDDRAGWSDWRGPTEIEI